MEIQQALSLTNILSMIFTFTGILFLLGTIVVSVFWSTSYLFSWLF